MTTINLASALLTLSCNAPHQVWHWQMMSYVEVSVSETHPPYPNNFMGLASLHSTSSPLTHLTSLTLAKLPPSINPKEIPLLWTYHNPSEILSTATYFMEQIPQSRGIGMHSISSIGRPDLSSSMVLKLYRISCQPSNVSVRKPTLSPKNSVRILIRN